MQSVRMRAGEPQADINTTPLIDVMLVLLIMFIVTLPPTRHAINMDNPRGPTPPDVQQPEPIQLTVAYGGALYWNDASVTRAEVDRRFAAEARKQTPAELHIRADTIARYGDVAAVMASAQRHGLVKMAVMDGG